MKLLPDKKEAEEVIESCKRIDKPFILINTYYRYILKLDKIDCLFNREHSLSLLLFNA